MGSASAQWGSVGGPLTGGSTQHFCQWATTDDPDLSTNHSAHCHCYYDIQYITDIKQSESAVRGQPNYWTSSALNSVEDRTQALCDAVMHYKLFGYLLIRLYTLFYTVYT